MSDELQSLLVRWARLEPLRIGYTAEDSRITLYAHGELVDAFPIHHSCMYEPEIEYHVRASIKDRGSLWKITMCEDGSYCSSVLDMNGSIYGSSALVALLTANNEALEALGV